jgi:hypothetical protein
MDGRKEGSKAMMYMWYSISCNLGKLIWSYGEANLRTLAEISIARYR